ncbi:MAG TPA: 1-deoxy-D-xylulose-5-phosphate reductoisomerase [Gemmatimonadales bacterium]|nr:1-deoxy-D-xylulose-5-phosphate reductoisomerase [Gemmatimonadales bacterium]
MTGVAVLGSTGSIGRSSLKVLARQRERFRVVALTAFGRREQLEAQVAAFHPAFVGLVSGDAVNGWKGGAECLVEAVTRPDVSIVINGIVGAAGLEATLAALQAGKRVALANKETLVMAGELVMRTARECGGEIVPVDSEHSAVLQCIAGRPRAGLERLILTASGGPFHSWEAERVRHATVEEALNHPTWRMGRKITVDSATLANKGLEVIEAHFLFGLPYERIEAVVHPQSVIHSFVEFEDGSVLAQLGFPNMELPILYALTHPERVADDGIVRFDPVAAGPLTFEPVRTEVFPALALGMRAGRTGGSAPAVFNAANEVAVAAFLGGRAPFGRIAEVIAAVLDELVVTEVSSVEAVLAADAWARRRAGELLQCS